MLLGVDLQFGAALAPSSEAYLECSFGEVEMVLFQAGALDQADLIAAAKGMEPKVCDGGVLGVARYGTENTFPRTCPTCCSSHVPKS